MTEVWFYHLQNQPLARALPVLVEKAIERGWRVAIQTAEESSLKALDDILWTYAPESFLAHGLASDPESERQPVVLTHEAGNPNGAALRIYAGEAEVDLDPENSPYERAILLFDGRVEAEVLTARKQWSRLKAQGFTLAYWQQSEEGRWERKI
jgi:DNA polymerase-3 subunit chi